MSITCRIAARLPTLTGGPVGRDCVGDRLPPGNTDATSARERDTGERGRREGDSTYRDRGQRLMLTGGAYRVSVWLPDRGQAATLTGGATGHNVRGRDTGERRAAGAAW